MTLAGYVGCILLSYTQLVWINHWNDAPVKIARETVDLAAEGRVCAIAALTVPGYQVELACQVDGRTRLVPVATSSWSSADFICLSGPSAPSGALLDALQSVSDALGP